MRWVVYPLVFMLTATVLGFATLGTAIALAWPKLPSLESLTDYRPRIPLRVYTSDGYLLGEFGEERRAFVKIDQVPQTLKNAILAAEDERFYEHAGVDPVGIVRAALANLASGGRGQGASTITMQVARNFFLSREKTYNRKLYEILLAVKIERNLTKDQILEIYINQIFLGHRAYGFAAAARTYFDKAIGELTLSEAAMLAGLPKAPSAYNPISNLPRATNRQRYVLRRMLEAGFIDNDVYQTAAGNAVKVATSRPADRPESADFVAEMARQIAVEQFGEDAYHLGIKIITTVSSTDQAAALHALRQGALAYDRRHGYRGPEAFVNLDSSGETDIDTLADQLDEFPNFGELASALVLESSPKKVRAFTNNQIITITDGGLSFAAPMLADRAPQARRIRPGAIIRVRKIDDKNWEILQLPEVEAALVSIDAATGAVRALVGGFDFNRNKFNHATQAYRQPGSSFKPFIYSAALERGYSPSSYVDDAPLYFPAEVTGSKAWEPQNYDNKFDGPMTLRDALTRSKNMVSIRLLQSITPEYAQDYITRFGFEPARHPAFLTMALGAGATTPWQLAAGYAVFANGGFKVEPFIVKEIIDGQGRTVAKVDPPVAGRSAPRVIDPRNAWLVDSMLQDVVSRGTAVRAKALRRQDLAGKTGTTNDYVDAWFAGYSPDIVAVSWVGFGQPRNLGRGETGSRAALPIWINYMRTALKDVPEKARALPPGLLPVSLPGKAHVDYHYAEYPPPEPPALPDIPELRYFMPDQPQQGGRPTVTAPARRPTPAPVEERTLPPLRP